MIKACLKTGYRVTSPILSSIVPSPSLTAWLAETQHNNGAETSSASVYRLSVWLLEELMENIPAFNVMCDMCIDLLVSYFVIVDGWWCGRRDSLSVGWPVSCFEAALPRLRTESIFLQETRTEWLFPVERMTNDSSLSQRTKSNMTENFLKDFH